MWVNNSRSLPVEKTERTPFAPLSGNGRFANDGLKNDTREQAQKKESYCPSSAIFGPPVNFILLTLPFSLVEYSSFCCAIRCSLTPLFYSGTGYSRRQSLMFHTSTSHGFRSTPLRDLLTPEKVDQMNQWNDGDVLNEDIIHLNKEQSVALRDPFPSSTAGRGCHRRDCSSAPNWPSPSCWLAGLFRCRSIPACRPPDRGSCCCRRTPQGQHKNACECWYFPRQVQRKYWNLCS